MLRKLNQFIHWVKTGRELLVEEDLSPSNKAKGKTQDSPYTIQVKEDLLAYPDNRWQWRLRKNGNPFTFPSVWTQGAESSKSRAIKQGEGAIEEIVLHHKNAEKKWENVDSNGQ